MPTVFSHPAVPIALGATLGPAIIPKHLLFAGIVGSMVPDLDVVAFAFGVHSPSPFAHRGFTHSFAFAAVLALIGALALYNWEASFALCFLFLFVSIASHGILDTFTNGGSGIALFWPWSSQRYFAPIRPIVASPLSVRRLLSPRGAQVLLSEVIWVWLPWLGTAFAARTAMERWITGA